MATGASIARTVHQAPLPVQAAHIRSAAHSPAAQREFTALKTAAVWNASSQLFNQADSLPRAHQARLT